MRRIDKQDPPAWLEKWKSQFCSKYGRSPKYEELDDLNRRRLRNELIIEQGYICCYCTRRISINASHIEHWRPRSDNKYKELELSYSNMFASCTGQEKEAVFVLRHCDPRKDNWFDERLPDLTSSDIERCLRYRIDGRVEPRHESSHYLHEIEVLMIENLGLNAPFLVRNRWNAIKESELMDDIENPYSIDDWESLARYYDEKHEGKFEEYCMMFIDLIHQEIG